MKFVQAAVLALVLTAVAGCERDEPGTTPPPGQGSPSSAKPGGPTVTVYTSVDETFAQMVLDEYEKRNRTELRVLFDSEAGKTTGLVNKIIAEAQAGRPRADVFWSSEIFNTIRLARMDLLEPYDSPAAADIPARFRDNEHRWTAAGVRGRVLAYDPAGTPPESLPAGWADLARPEFARHVAIANPLFGTTRGHVSAMFALWGADDARAYLEQLKENGATLLDSNGATVRALLDNARVLAMTDTDDVLVAHRRNPGLLMLYLDMGDGGTLLIPCTVAIVKGGPAGAASRDLVDYLVSADVERMLAQSDSGNIPVRESLRRELGMEWPPETRVDFDKVADSMDEAMAAVREILIR